MNVSKKDVVIFQIEDMLSRMNRDRVESFGAHFDNGHDFIELMENALALLKEQEPKTVLHRDDGYYCPWCSTIATRIMGVQKLHPGTRYCPYCGQAVKWGD